MKSVRPMLLQGNQKLSQAIFHWDLPAVTSCPGATELCLGKCYARKGRYVFPQVFQRLEWCLKQASKADFAERMVQEIRRKGSAFVVRIHCSGDFFNEDYTNAWVRIIRSSPVTRFFAYTRSWRVPAIVPHLEELAALSNMRLWYSCDAEAMPGDVLPSIRLAYLQVSQEEEIPAEVSLIFRDHPLRRDTECTINGIPICPYDTPQGRKREINCGTCGWCWQ